MYKLCVRNCALRPDPNAGDALHLERPREFHFSDPRLMPGDLVWGISGWKDFGLVTPGAARLHGGDHHATKQRVPDLSFVTIFSVPNSCGEFVHTGAVMSTNSVLTACDAPPVSVSLFLAYADDPVDPGLRSTSRPSFHVRGGAEVVVLFRKFGLNGAEDVAIYHGFQLTDNGVALLHFERGVPAAAFLPKLCLFTIPLSDPLCRVHHSPVFLKLIAEAAANGEDADLERSCVKTVACGLSQDDHISKVACLLGPRVSPMHWGRGIGHTLAARLEWIRQPGPEYAYDITNEYVSRWFVVATGKDAEPVVHVSEYKCAKASRGKRVLVVSCENSGLEVYLDLCDQRILPSRVVRDVEHALPLEVPDRVQGLLDANISTLAKLLVATGNWDSCRTQARHVGQRLTVLLLDLVTWLRDVDSTGPARDARRAQQPQRHVVSDFVNLSVVLLLVPVCSMERNAFGLAADIAQEDPSFLWILLDLAYFVVTVGLESATDVEHLDFLSAWCSARCKASSEHSLILGCGIMLLALVTDQRTLELGNSSGQGGVMLQLQANSMMVADGRTQQAEQGRIIVILLHKFAKVHKLVLDDAGGFDVLLQSTWLRR